MRDETKNAGRMMPLLIAGSALLVVAGGVAFYFAAQTMGQSKAEPAQRVVVNKTSCEPMNLTVDAGRSTFEIHNASDRPIEWEILDGVMVVEERENIAPGFHSRLSAKLRPGVYDITCGLLTNPRGKLTVLASAAFDESNKSVPVTAFIGPLSELRVYLATEANALQKNVERLDQQIKQGNLDGAKQAWHEARLPYRRIETFVEGFSDLENAIDALPDFLEQREQDKNFTGFHRLEYGLWNEGETRALEPISQKLIVDVSALKDRFKALKSSPDHILTSARRQADATAQMLRGESDNRWAPTSQDELRTSIAAIEKFAGLMLPLVLEKAPDAAQRYQQTRIALKTSLDGDLSQKGATETVATRLDAISASLDAMQLALGLD